MVFLTVTLNVNYAIDPLLLRDQLSEEESLIYVCKHYILYVTIAGICLGVQ